MDPDPNFFLNRIRILLRMDLDPDSEKRSDPDPEKKRTRIWNTGKDNWPYLLCVEVLQVIFENFVCGLVRFAQILKDLKEKENVKKH